MPLPWKKDKDKPKKNLNRSLSRFIDEIRASKRGESLVVETGFPTSVIDLIVKNRSRFEKKHRDYYRSDAQSAVNTPRQQQQQQHPNTASILNSINTVMSETESNDDLVRETSNRSSSDAKEEEFGSDSGKEICLVKQDIEIQEVEESVRKDRVFMIVIKVLVVFILAISTKKFAVSITLSAFILVLLEILFKNFANEYRRLTVSVHIERGERRMSLIGVDDDSEVDFRKEFEMLVKETKATEIDFGDSEATEIDKGFEFSACDRSVIWDEMVEKPRRSISEFPAFDRVVVGDELFRKRRRTVSDKLRAKFKKLGSELKNRRSKKDCKLEQSNVESTDCVIEDAGKDQEKDEEGAEVKVVDSNQENIGAAKMKDGEENDVCVTFERPRRTNSTKVRAQRFVKKIGNEFKHRRSKKEGKLDKHTVHYTQEETIQEGEEQEKDEDDHSDEDEEEEKVIYDVISISESRSDLGFQKSIGRRRNLNWSTSILVLIVVAGLIGGRIMALVLSILCLLLHKLVGATKPPRFQASRVM